MWYGSRNLSKISQASSRTEFTANAGRENETHIRKNVHTHTHRQPAINVGTWTPLHWSALLSPDRWWGLKDERKETHFIKQNIRWLPWWHDWLMSSFHTQKKYAAVYVCACYVRPGHSVSGVTDWCIGFHTCGWKPLPEWTDQYQLDLHPLLFPKKILVVQNAQPQLLECVWLCVRI